VCDRRAMLVKDDGTFLTLRTHPKMSAIQPRVKDGSVILDIDGQVLETELSDKRTDARIWKDIVTVRVADEVVNTKISEFMGETVRLVFMDDNTERCVNADWADSRVSLADGSPVSIVNTASLAHLSDVAGHRILMSQFRPNIIVRTNRPWAEDSWKTITVGTAILELIKPIDRCKIVTLDPETGEPLCKETMSTLIQTRRSGDKRVKGVLFGWAAIVRRAGEITVGNPVNVIGSREAWPIAKQLAGKS